MGAKPLNIRERRAIVDRGYADQRDGSLAGQPRPSARMSCTQSGST